MLSKFLRVKKISYTLPQKYRIQQFTVFPTLVGSLIWDFLPPSQDKLLSELLFEPTTSFLACLYRCFEISEIVPNPTFNPPEKIFALSQIVVPKFRITFYTLSPGNHCFSLRGNDKSARDLATLWTPVCNDIES